ncbi:MAG: ComF family protein [Salibacteraceae bacterium]
MMLSQYLRDFTHLTFPFNCYGCSRALEEGDRPICRDCIEHFPRTFYWQQDDNEVEKIFWARIPVEGACSYMFFNKDGIAQALMHQLKYNNKPIVGEWLGRLFGEEIKDSVFDNVDILVPVPLHRKKEKSRGYNQSNYIVKGMSESMNKRYSTNAIERIRANESQTKKGRFERWINVRELFRVSQPEVIQNKHVLLVDDVVTTGATLEACADAVLQVRGTKVSIATIACPTPF